MHYDHDIIIHPTQKPMELTEKLLKASKPKNKFNVLIPFAGSGSECIVVRKMGGNYISFEINPNFLKLANE
jgi:DNA modification methylase